MSRLAFGDCVLDLAERRLWRDGIELHLAPKAFDLLAYLIAARPRAVGKDELFGRVWGGAFVGDNTVATTVRDLRRALGDDARDPRYIRTVHSFGYAFDNDASSVAGAAPTSRWILVHDQRVVTLGDGEHVLGRSGHGVLVIDAPSVSRRHARIVVRGDRATCEDLGSTNGTWVGTTPADRPVTVTPGAEIRLGAVVVRIGIAPDATTEIIGGSADAT